MFNKHKKFNNINNLNNLNNKINKFNNSQQYNKKLYNNKIALIHLQRYLLQI